MVPTFLPRAALAAGFVLALASLSVSQLDCGSTNFCTATQNSTGSPATISSSEGCIVAHNDFTLSAAPVPNQFGLFFYASSQAGGGAGVPFGNGSRCIGAPGDTVYRLPLVQATSNVLSLHVDLGNPPSAAATISAGSTWFFQAWFRDPAGGGSLFNLSDGLGITFRPPQYDILHIILDDIGIEYLRAYDDQNSYDGDNPFNTQEDPDGSNLYPWTPCLDQLAAQGIRFNQFHVNPTCSTTRAAMLSGRYAFRNGLGSLTDPKRVGTLGEFGVGAGNDEFTIADVVETAGYRTGWTGKWHLALTTEETSLGGAPGYGYGHCRDYGKWDEVWLIHANLGGLPTPPPIHIPGISGSTDPSHDVLPGYYNYYSYASFGADPPLTQVLNLGEYTTEKQRLRTVELIEQLELTYPGDPWLITASFNAAHYPYGDFPDTAWLTTTEYWPETTPYGLPIPGGAGTMTAWTGNGALIEALDSRLRAMFDALGGLDAVLEDTLVIVTGDNGSAAVAIASAISQHGKDLGSVYPLITGGTNNHFKHRAYEQGTKVPMIIAGPLVVNPGRTCNAPIDAVDVHATIADLASADIASTVADGRPQDGRSFLDIILDTSTDAEHIDQVRDFCFVERFSPNGDPNAIAPPVSTWTMRDRGYLGRTPNGWFKLIRELHNSGEVDELYHLYGTQVPSIEGEIDPHELNDLMGNPAHAADYEALVAAMEALLASEP